MKPLGSKAALSIVGDRATVVPERPFHYGFIPGRYRIEMVKKDAAWCFTGEVHVD
jgi:hypothetical protein